MFTPTYSQSSRNYRPIKLRLMMPTSWKLMSTGAVTVLRLPSSALLSCVVSDTVVLSFLVCSPTVPLARS